MGANVSIYSCTIFIGTGIPRNKSGHQTIKNFNRFIQVFHIHSHTLTRTHPSSHFNPPAHTHSHTPTPTPTHNPTIKSIQQTYLVHIEPAQGGERLRVETENGKIILRYFKSRYDNLDGHEIAQQKLPKGGRAAASYNASKTLSGCRRNRFVVTDILSHK